MFVGWNLYKDTVVLPHHTRMKYWYFVHYCIVIDILASAKSNSTEREYQFVTFYIQDVILWNSAFYSLRESFLLHISELYWKLDDVLVPFALGQQQLGVRTSETCPMMTCILRSSAQFWSTSGFYLEAQWY